MISEFHLRSNWPREGKYCSLFTHPNPGCFPSWAEQMGGCVSTSSKSTCSSKSNGDTLSPSCWEVGLFGQRRTKRTFSDHVISLQHLTSIPNRIFMNGKSRTSCIFTQQGRKGINQDAMIVWEVSAVLSIPYHECYLD